MLFVLAGPSYVGKKSAMYHFIKLYSFSSIIPYTTKPHNPESGEVEGIHYHYVHQNDIVDITNDENYIFDKPFNVVGIDGVDVSYACDDIYAYKISDIAQAITSHSNFIIHASVGNAIKIHEKFKSENDKQLYILFLRYYSDLSEAFFATKCFCNREDEVFTKRFLHAKKEMSIYGSNDSCFDEQFESDKTYLMCEKLENYILPKLEVMPTSPDKIPGPLSDKDLLYTFENRKSNQLIVKKDDKKITKDEFKKMLCGCGMHITLADRIRIVSRKLDNLINMSEEESILQEKLSNIFEQHVISNGYLLKPNEIILCSSKEEIEIPHDIYAVVFSKFSYSQLGLSIEIGTSIIKSGHKGKIHFQIKNETNNYIRIFPNIEVAQLIFFRTISPSLIADDETRTSHNYDKESISPISRFRENNQILDNVKVKRSKGNIIISEFLKCKITEVLGILLTTLLSITLLYNIVDKINNFITYVIDNTPPLVTLLYLSITLFLLEIMFFVIGKIFLRFIRVLKTIVIKIWIYCFIDTSDN